MMKSVDLNGEKSKRKSKLSIMELVELRSC